jgi:hypothetical protein
MEGLSAVFTNATKVQVGDEATLMVRKIGFVLSRTASLIKSAGVIQGDFDKANGCMTNIATSDITEDVVTFLNASIDAYSVGEYQSLGYYLGAIGNKYCFTSQPTFSITF